MDLEIFTRGVKGQPTKNSLCSITQYLHGGSNCWGVGGGWGGGGGGGDFSGGGGGGGGSIEIYSTGDFPWGEG